MSRDPLSYRDPRLVVSLVGVVAEGDLVPEAELLDLYTDGKWNRDTIRRTIRELATFGALERVHRPAGPVYRLTRLGRAWLDRELLPLPGLDDLEDVVPS